MTRLALLVSLLALASGCSVASLDQSGLAPAKNKCSSDSDCGGGTCDPTLNVCSAPEGQFGHVVFQVTPPSNTNEYGGVPFVFPKDISIKGGDLPIDVGVISIVKGSVQPTAGAQTGCQTAYGATKSATAPVKLTFTSTTSFLGLSAPEYTATTSLNSNSGDYEFKLWIPPDDYDIYVEPLSAQETGTCAIVPQLIHQSVESATELTLPLKLQPPSALSVDVLWPITAVSTNDKTPLQNWQVDVVEPAHGHSISAPVKLEYHYDPTDLEYQHYIATVYYVPLADHPGDEIVRVKPPEGTVAPTLVAQRGPLEINKPGQARIEALEQMPQPVTLDKVILKNASGDTPLDATQIDPTDPSKKKPVSATIRFVSTKLNLYALAGTQAYFETSVEATDGVASNVELVPGEYDVYVAPPLGSGYATTHTTLTAGTQSFQGGKTITLDAVSAVSGSVLTPEGKAAVGAAVQATASPVSPTPLEVAVGEPGYKPQASTAVVAANGQFSFQADAGTFDFSIRPVDGTSFAWLVRPNVEVQSGAHDLGSMTLPLPVAYSGQVTAAGSLVPGALIQTYILLDSGGYTADRAGAKSVVQIAETRVADDGSYQLFLPSHLN